MVIHFSLENRIKCLIECVKVLKIEFVWKIICLVPCLDRYYNLVYLFGQKKTFHLKSLAMKCPTYIFKKTWFYVTKTPMSSMSLSLLKNLSVYGC